MKKIIIIIASLILILLILLNLLFSLRHSSNIYYESKELAISSLLLEQSYVLESIPVNNKQVIFIYDQYHEALFIATISKAESNNNFFIENKTNAWKIGGGTPTMINGKYHVDDKNIEFYAWKGSDNLDELINNHKVIKQNQYKIKKYIDDVSLLLLTDEGMDTN